MAMTVLALAALACQALPGGNESENDNPDLVLPTAPAQSGDDVILSDDFSSARWGTGTDADSAVEYVGNALNFDVFSDNFFVWSTPGDETYNDVHMEVTVINNDTHSTTAFGLICDKAAGNDFYYLVMTPAGQYAIAKAVSGETDLFLTNNDEWADSDLIPVNAASYRVGADCGNGTLALYVDGQLVDSISDLTYSSGRVAVFVWSGEEVGIKTDVSFDDFLMTELP
jgi:hypothetical protein